MAAAAVMSRLLPRFDREREAAADAQTLKKILIETGEALPVSTASSSVPGDPHKLRGMPVVGVRGGLGGAIAGTKPGQSRDLDAWSPPRRSLTWEKDLQDP